MTKQQAQRVILVHADKVPMVPNFGQQPRFIITIQPAGTHFNPPAAMTLPNVDGMAPGQKTEMFSFDHDLGMFVSIGPATVSEDGMMVQSDPGVGVIKGGWHGGGGPAPPADAEPVDIHFQEEGEASALVVGNAAMLRVESPAAIEGKVQALTGDEEELVLVVGEEKEVIAIGTPGPKEEPGITWRSEDDEVLDVEEVSEETVDQDEEQVVRSVAKVMAKAPGRKTIDAEHKKGSGEKMSKKATKSVEGVVADVKLEIVPVDGKHTFINADNHYSEATKLKVTVIYPEGHAKAGEPIDDDKILEKILDIEFSEKDETSYYQRMLPTSVKLGTVRGPHTVAGEAGNNSAILVVEAFSSPEAPTQARPDPAKVRARARISGVAANATPENNNNTIEIHQWIDEEAPGGFIDWLYDHVTFTWDKARGHSNEEAQVAANLINAVRQLTPDRDGRTCGAVIGGAIGSQPRTVHISPVCGGGGTANVIRRPDLSDKWMETVFLHEARHVWQHVQQLRDDAPIHRPDKPSVLHNNDEDYDGYMDVLQFHSADALLLEANGPSKNLQPPEYPDNHFDDGVRTPEGSVCNGFEQDAYRSAFQWTGTQAVPGCP